MAIVMSSTIHSSNNLFYLLVHLDTPSQREDLTAVAGSYAEPRRSSRQRREVYGTLNETMLVRNPVADPTKGTKEKDIQVRD